MADVRYTTVGGEVCQNCNRPYKTIYNVPDPIWAEVTGWEAGPGGAGLLCIPCFDWLAAAKGIRLLWQPEVHDV